MIYFLNFIFSTPKPLNGGFKTKYVIFYSPNTTSMSQSLAPIWGVGGHNKTYY